MKVYLLQPKKSQTEHQLVKGRKVSRFSAGKTESHCLLVIPFSRCNVQASGLSPVVRALVKLTQWHVLSNQPSFQLDRSARVRLIQRRGRVSIRFKYCKIVRQHGLTMVDIWILMNVGSSIFQCSSLQPPGVVPVLIHPAVCGSLDVNLLHLSRLGLVVRTSMQHSIGVPLVPTRSPLRKHRTGRTDGCNICCMLFVHLVEYKSSWIPARHSYTKIACLRLSGNMLLGRDIVDEVFKGSKASMVLCLFFVLKKYSSLSRIVRLAAVDGLIASHACGQVGQTQLESLEQLTHEDSTYIYNLCQYRYTMRHTQLGKDIQIYWNIKMYGTKWPWSSMDAFICQNTSASVAFLKRFGRYGAKPKIALLHVLGNNSAGVAARDFVHPLGFSSRRILGCHENWIRIWIHYHPLEYPLEYPLEHPLEHPLPKWKSMTHSPTMKIHGPFRPWIQRIDPQDVWLLRGATCWILQSDT